MVKATDLAVGMYVILDLSWIRHSFLKPNFLIRSKKQIRKIKADGIETVKVDFSRSTVTSAEETAAASQRIRGREGVRSTTSARTVKSGRQKPPAVTTPSSGAAEDHPGGPDTVTVPEKPEQPGSGIDTVTLEEKPDQPGSGIDTVTLEDKPEQPGSGIDTVDVPEKAPGEYETMPTVKIDQLAVGMYVMMPPEYATSVEGDEFMLVRQDQIDALRASGMDEILVDADRSETELPQRPDSLPPMLPREKLQTMVQDPALTPDERAGVVYHHSLIAMEHILSRPTAENIQHGTEVIRDIVGYILADRKCSDALVLMTSHDYHTHTHSVNVGVYALLLAQLVFRDIEPEELEKLGIAYFLHDIGKCQIPADLISKSGKLTEPEWELMRSHPDRGIEVLASHELLTPELSQIIMQHHERDDGHGYPLGSGPTDIGLPARICTIADVYDALTSSRPYKATTGMLPFQALAIMKEEMVTPHNRELYKTFVSIFGD